MIEDLTGLYFWTTTDEDALTYDAVPAVDLSIADSPVVPYSWSKEPVQTMRTVGGKYLLLYGRPMLLNGKVSKQQHAEVVTEEELRVMRARFLIRHGYYALYLETVMPYYAKDAVLHAYFGGGLWQMPDELLHKARTGWRLHLQAVLSSPPPDKYTVEGQISEIKRLLRSGK